MLLHIVAKESLYMLLLSGVACGAALVQTLFRKYVGDYSSFIFSGSNYQYNYFMYFLGAAIYFFCVVFFYKKLLAQDFKNITKIRILYRIICWIVLIFWLVMVIIAEFLGLFFLVLGMTTNLQPEAFMVFSLVGWPGITFLFLVIVNIHDFDQVKKTETPDNNEYK